MRNDSDGTVLRAVSEAGETKCRSGGLLKGRVLGLLRVSFPKGEKVGPFV